MLAARSPAKLNLFLHILGRRSDGYHNLQTVFQLLDYCDDMIFTRRADSEICLSSNALSTMGPPEKNLVIRAARLLQQISDTTQGVDIQLTKRIPIGGGLGGGSSNAATTLMALNQLWQLGINPSVLAQLGLQLGADVPVFIQGNTAWAEGIGEILQPIELAEKWFVVLVPPCTISSAEFFLHDELTRNTPAITIQQFLSEPIVIRNDFERLACNRYPMVAQAINWLSQFAPARLTGSGACVFAAVKNQDQARAIVQQTPQPLQGFAAKGVNRFR